MKKIYILILVIIFMIIVTCLNSRIRDFESITGITSENVNKILIGEKVLYENYDELIQFFKYYRYRRFPSRKFKFSEEFPDGVHSYVIIIYLNNGKDVYINPIKTKILIDMKLYEIVDGQINQDFLKDFYESLD